MRIGIMQPYFLPYQGYFQLIKNVDIFVVYDNIEYTKKGWINRNRALRNGEPRTFTIPLKKDSDYLEIIKRTIADTYSPLELFRGFENDYKKSEKWSDFYPILQNILYFQNLNLFSFIENSIFEINRYLGIETPIVRSSEIVIPPNLQGQDRVIAMCRALNAKQYVNPIGGLDLYDNKTFNDFGIELSFIQSKLTKYSQLSDGWVPGLSIIDSIFNMDIPKLNEFLSSDFEIFGKR